MKGPQALALGLLLAHGHSLAQAVGPREEGPLNNSAYQPIDAQAWASLEAGDALVREEETRARGFDAWRTALTSSPPGALVPGEGALPEALADRCALGVEDAVLRRLEQLSESDLGAWTRRCEQVASGESLGDRALERSLPGTQRAARAALRLGDAEAECAREERARLWWQRAARHARLAGDAPALAALARRTDTSAPPAPPDPLKGATGMLLDRTHPISGFRFRAESLDRVPLGRGMRSGAAGLVGAGVLVQGPIGALWFDDQALSGGAAPRRIDLEQLLGFEFRKLNPFAASSAGGWTNAPASGEAGFYMVVDRGEPSRSMGTLDSPPRGNYVICLGGVGSEVPTDRWRVDGGTMEFAEGPACVEWLPGPALADGLLYVTCRTLGVPNEQEAAGVDDVRLVALDPASGALVWERLVTQASDLSEARRFRASGQLRTVGAPLLAHGGQLIFVTNTGLVTSHALDGRANWSLRTRRRDAGERGWPGSSRPLAVDHRVLVAPGDSDHLYLVDPRPGAMPLAEEPAPIGAALAVAGTVAERLVLLGREGARAALLELPLGRPGPARPLLELAPAERFRGLALLTETRALLCTNRRVYLFDAEDEMRLIASVPLPEGASGGDLVAVAGQVFVVGVDEATRIELLRD